VDHRPALDGGRWALYPQDVGDHKMRMTCPKCKNRALILVHETTQHVTETITVEKGVTTCAWGYFDADGAYEEQDSQEIDVEEFGRECDTAGDDDLSERTSYVQCDKCNHIMVGHPLT